jgi:hypothetical protein
MAELARRYYAHQIDDLSAPLSIGHGLTLYPSSQVAPLCSESPADLKFYPVCLSAEAVESGRAFLTFGAFECAVHFYTGVSFDESYTVTRSGYRHKENRLLAGWGGSMNAPITAAALEFATRLIPELEPLILPEEYSRVANALRLYYAADASRQPDFALLGFIGCLESLFSIATQELNFRLCLTISKFCEDTVDDQRRYFSELKKLYGVRSKIAHGDSLAKSEESAAIQLVDHWVPYAARVCRAAILRLLECSLFQVFNSKAQHEKLLEYVLFYANLGDALRALDPANPLGMPKTPGP